MPDARSPRDARGHFTQPFRLAAVRYALACGKSQRAAAGDMGISDKTLGEWVGDARPDAAGVVDAPRFDEPAQLRARNRELPARNQRLAAERDFVKKCAGFEWIVVWYNRKRRHSSLGHISPDAFEAQQN